MPLEVITSGPVIHVGAIIWGLALTCPPPCYQNIIQQPPFLSSEQHSAYICSNLTVIISSPSCLLHHNTNPRIQVTHLFSLHLSLLSLFFLSCLHSPPSISLSFSLFNCSSLSYIYFVLAFPTL